MADGYDNMGMMQMPEPPYYGKIAQEKYSEEQDNLAQWRLDVEKDIEAVEHKLKDEYIEVYINEKGQMEERWQRAPPSERIFNDYGVRQIMKSVSTYMRKVFTLSYWDTLEEISVRVHAIAQSLRILIFTNFHSFGVDDPSKISQLPTTVLYLHQIIEANYRRAYLGKEAKQLAPSWNINENLNNQGGQSGMGNQMPKKFSFLNPFGGWGRKKY